MVGVGLLLTLLMSAFETRGDVGVWLAADNGVRGDAGSGDCPNAVSDFCLTVPLSTSILFITSSDSPPATNATDSLLNSDRRFVMEDLVCLTVLKSSSSSKAFCTVLLKAPSPDDFNVSKTHSSTSSVSSSLSAGRLEK